MSPGLPPPDAAPERTYRERPPAARLIQLIDSVKRALQRAAALEGFVVFMSGAIAAIVAGAILFALGAQAATVALFELLAILAAFLFVAIRYGHLFMTAFRRPVQVALWLDRAIDDSHKGADERVALRSAIELANDRHRKSESLVLREAAIDAATESVLGLDAQALVKQESRRSLKRRLVPLGTAAAIMAGFAIFSPRSLMHAFSALAAIGTIDSALAPLTGEPRLDDIKLTLRYPAYSERLSRTVSGGNGEIHALPGTEVVIETRARDELAQATVLVTHGEGGETDSGEPAKIAAEVDGRRIKATLIVQRAGRYRFKLRTQKGEALEERRGHEIELELDDPPEITLIEPEESPLEVNERDRLSLVFDAKDDFGLGDVQVSWRVIGGTREGKEPLTSASRGQKRYPGSAQLELANLQLKPGDRVAYTLEVRDNDTVNGPKVGASATKELRVYSKSAHHEQVLSLQEQAIDELVHILGDNLDSALEVKTEPEPYKKILDAGDAIVERSIAADQLLRRTVAAVRKDPLGRKAVAEAFEAARSQLYSDSQKLRNAIGYAKKIFASLKKPDRTSGTTAQKFQDGMVSGLEKNVVYLADLLNDQRMIDAEALVKELRQQQQELKKALEAYKNAPDAEKRKILAQSIKEIKQRISEIMQQLAKLKGSIPADFVNPDALETKDTQAGMDAVQRMIEEGDLEGAMAELDKMLNETENMMSQLSSGRQELGSREYTEIQEQAEKLWKDLESVEKEQRDLAKQTDKISKEVLERMKSRLGDANSFVEKQKKRLQQAQQGLDRAKPGSHAMEGDLHDQAERRLEDGIKALEARDFGAAKEMVENAAEGILQLEQDAHRRADQAHRFGDLFNGGKTAEKAEKELRKVRPILDEVLRDIEKLMPPPESLLSKEEKEKLDKQSERESQLKDQAGKLAEQLDKLNQQVPIVGPGMKSMLDEAQGAMGQAGSNLGQGDAPAALNQQRRALDALNRLKQELAKKGQGGGSGGVPLPFGNEPEGGGHAADGNDPLNDQRVEIPKPEQFQAPAEFRKDIMEAAKQGTVEDYREAVRRYYEELVK